MATNLQHLIDTAHAGHHPPAPQPSTAQRALAAEGMHLNRDGTVTPYDGARHNAAPVKEDTP